MTTCQKCKGSGIYIDEQTDCVLVTECPVCSGTGRITLLRWILAKIGVRT